MLEDLAPRIPYLTGMLVDIVHDAPDPTLVRRPDRVRIRTQPDPRRA